MIPNMTKYVVTGSLPICDVPTGGTVEGSAIPDVELLLQICAIAPVPDPKSRVKEVESENGEASSN